MRETVEKSLAPLARIAAGEGAVLLKNEHAVLPFKKGEKIAIFGRTQIDYYKSGTGSGGNVNTDYVVNILDGLRANETVTVNETLAKVYADWILDNPFDDGMGWAQEPWSQIEMPLSRELVERAKAESDTALIILGRTAGEDKDSGNEPGSYMLSDGEEDMLRAVTEVFDRTVVFLNIGSVIDMNWLDRYPISSVLIGWQGGQEGGNAAADVLCGNVNPSGKLSDTIVYDIKDYPSDKNFGAKEENVYEEDIYVGYRYFESFAKDKVRYPFGFGLSYTTFQVKCTDMTPDGDLKVTVKNTGNVPGKEVVQVYVAAPQGMLGKPDRSLIAFEKTSLLAPGESEELTLSFPMIRLASYDDSGRSGHKNAWVMEAGEYELFVGTDVRSAKSEFAFMLPETQVLEQCEEAMTPVKPFTRMIPAEVGFGTEPVPTRSYDLEERMMARRPKDLPLAPKGLTLSNVKEGKATMEDFVAQFTNQELMALVRGEGMCSPKVTPGIASAFGGLSDALKAHGLPVAGCADGPSGIRMDCGTHATSLPNGTLLACTFNLPLVEELYVGEGKELRKNNIDTLLGPGINIHRHPLNGRNFEYFSEDPLLTGLMAAAQLRGMHQEGVTGTIKHFCCNNQETDRHGANAVVSERALREIYLKPFEIAVRKGEARSIMTSYNPVNGIWSAGNYDLCTTILRGEWGYQGIVMTDWWAKVSDDQGKGDEKNVKAMVRAQNDLYMVCSDAWNNSAGDNLEESLEKGLLTRGELQRCAMNISNFLMNSLSMERMMHPEEFEDAGDDGASVDLFPEASVEFKVTPSCVMRPAELTPCDVAKRIETQGLGDEGLCITEAGKADYYAFKVEIEEDGVYDITARLMSTESHLAQLPVVMWLGNRIVTTFVTNGTDGKWVDITHEGNALGKGTYLMRLIFNRYGANLSTFTFKKKSE